MIHKIYHAKKMVLLGEDFPEEFNENAYDLVATIDIINGPTPHQADLTFEDAQVSLEKAFELSQNFEHSWLKNPGVVTIKETNPKGCRSTSMGDVIELDGVKYMCEDLRWKALSKKETKIKITKELILSTIKNSKQPISMKELVVLVLGYEVGPQYSELTRVVYNLGKSGLIQRHGYTINARWSVLDYLPVKEGQVIAYKAKLKDSDERQWQTYRVHTHGDKWNARIIINSAGAFDDACIFEEEIITNVHMDKIIILE